MGNKKAGAVSEETLAPPEEKLGLWQIPCACDGFYRIITFRSPHAIGHLAIPGDISREAGRGHSHLVN